MPIEYNYIRSHAALIARHYPYTSYSCRLALQLHSGDRHARFTCLVIGPQHICGVTDVIRVYYWHTTDVLLGFYWGKTVLLLVFYLFNTKVLLGTTGCFWGTTRVLLGHYWSYWYTTGALAGSAGVLVATIWLTTGCYWVRLRITRVLLLYYCYTTDLLLVYY